MKFNAKQMRKITDKVNELSSIKHIEDIQNQIISRAIQGHTNISYIVPLECNSGTVDMIKSKLRKLKFKPMTWYDEKGIEEIYISW